MGRFRARCKLGFDLSTQVHHGRDEPGIVGAAIYREILIDQRSLRSHPNKAVDVVVCQTSWIDSGSRFINSGPTLHNKSRGDCPLAFGLFPLGRLGCRRDRRRYCVVQRLIHLSTHPEPVEQHRQLPGHRYRRSLLRILPTTLAEPQPISS